MKAAFNVFDGLRAAIKTLQPIEEVQALNALQHAHVISFNENVQISSAMSTMRAFAQKLNDWEAQHSSN